MAETNYGKLRSRLYDGIYSDQIRELDEIVKDIDCKSEDASKLVTEFFGYAERSSNFALYGIPDFDCWENNTKRMMTVVHKIVQRCPELGNLAQRLYRHSPKMRDRDETEFMRILGKAKCDSLETEMAHAYFIRQKEYYITEASCAAYSDEQELLSLEADNFHKLASALHKRCQDRFT